MPNSVSKNLDLLAEKWGMPRIDRLPNGGWRLWFDGWHLHHKYSYGTCAIDGETLESAIMLAWLTFQKTPPSKGGSCREGCERYEVDIY